ncbi:MAG TPA: excinuclease ABC subunit UvrA [Peptococcaceae bacterium]|nr:MAG: UvrABC system protein A [Clostridia bacterium 41_269]HBT20857.1 excinuclease ABC subunit UvrA [Peptococcaceae bacterium]
MAEKNIVIKGAREHNLKNIDVVIPRDKLVVITGLSGSGKSTLAFDTIYAEGQRRYVESLSAYARQFLGQMDKPDVDYIEGLSPAISIDQKNSNRNPRSTVGTITEIYDYLRLLFARIGKPHCPKCYKPIAKQTVTQMVDQLLNLPEGTKIQIMAPVVRRRKGEHQNILSHLKKEGFVRVRIDGEIYYLDEDIKIDKNKKHTIEVVVDRLIIKDGISGRLADSIETALKMGQGIMVAAVSGRGDLVFSENFACVDCGLSIEEITPRTFSFNSPYGACPECSGLGSKTEIDPDYVVPDKSKSINQGAIVPWSKGNNTCYLNLLRDLSEIYGFSLDVPFGDLDPQHQKLILYGTNDKLPVIGFKGYYYRNFEGVIPNLERKYRETTSEYVKSEIEKYMSTKLCSLCRGTRLKKESLSVLVGGKNIYEVTLMPVLEARKFFDELDLSERERKIAGQILKEIRQRLDFLIRVGLGYLALNRPASTLSGGESQRIRLATQIGSGLVGVLYILDEPSIGLHPRDNSKLIDTLKDLRDLGNTLIVVEHDMETMLAADHIIDIGPGAGANGGRVVAQGTVEDIMNSPESITGQYLSGKKKIPVPSVRRRGNGKKIIIKGAREHNLKNIDVEIPLGVFTCVTGVSGSGKSTLIYEILYKKLASEIYGAKVKPGEHDAVYGMEHLDKVVDIDQSPIGRTPRSNPATYTGVFDYIRELFSMTPEAKMRGYKPGRFSFNVKGGRCEVCRGDGVIKIEMHFFPDVYVPCEECKGKRYNRETLEIRYKGKNIADILEMTVDEAVEFFKNVPRIYNKLKTMQDVGLGYIRLGQPATQLSGGEAQRVKLAAELSRRGSGRTIYILDEPTTGLHSDDIRKLLKVLDRLVDNGNTVVVIEHNLDVIKTADYIIDLGPEGGDEGGYVVAVGTPEEVAEVEESYTGRFLRRVLERDADVSESGGKTAAGAG